jgi:hypothetical protein
MQSPHLSTATATSPPRTASPSSVAPTSRPPSPSVQPQVAYETSGEVSHLNCVKSSQTYSSQLILHPGLQRFDLVIQKRLHRFLCTQHKWLIPTSNVRSHLQRSHTISGHLPSDQDISQFILDFDLQEGYPDFPSTSIPQIDGLEYCEEGFLCPGCSHGYTSKKSLREHLFECPLVNTPVDFDSLSATPLQRFSNTAGPSKAWFAVHGKGTHSSNPIIAAFINQVLRDEKIRPRLPAADLDRREVVPWLQHTKWHVEVDGFDTAALQQLVDIPKTQDTFGGLQQVVHELFEDAQSLIYITNEFVLCTLNTPEPGSEGYVSFITQLFYLLNAV